jgi:menaquinone-9 beta-reductase
MSAVDVLIAGGGPAGLATAIALAERGFETAVVDPGRPPVDKACGEGLMPDGLDALDRLGVRLAEGDGAAFRGIRFIDNGVVAEARFHGRHALGIRRTVLHQRLVERAEELGVRLSWGERVDLTAHNEVRVEGKRAAYDWLIGADGSDSRVRTATGLAPRHSRRRIGMRRHFRIAPWTDLIEVYWHRLGQAYVTPIARDEICIAITARKDELRFGDLARCFPALAKKTEHAELSSRVRGGISSMSTLSRVYRANVALVGDASCTVDALTGEGLSLAFRQSLALAEALARGNLASYSAAHGRISRRARATARLLLAMNDYPGWRARVIRALANRPAVFSDFLAAQTGTISPASIGLGNLAGLARQFLTA